MAKFISGLRKYQGMVKTLHTRGYVLHTLTTYEAVRIHVIPDESESFCINKRYIFAVNKHCYSGNTNSS